MQVSNRVKDLPPYLFSEFQRKKKKLQKQGVDVIDLGIGAPDLPTPQFVIDKLIEEAKVSSNHRYSSYDGISDYRNAVAQHYRSHYGVELDPDSEVLTLIGSKEGIANLVQAVINPGDTVLIPDPGYPVYRTAIHLAGGVSEYLPLDQQNGYIPKFNLVPDQVKEKAKLLFLNYPSNPTSATVGLNTFLEAITFVRDNHMLLAHDAAYDLVTFGEYKAPSVLQVPNAKDNAIEFGSLSKSFNMTGWRIGYVVGNKTIIKAIATLKSNMDTCQFIPIQKAAATALKSDLSVVKENNAVFQERMEKLYGALHEIGMEVQKPKGTIFLWAKTPANHTSIEFSNMLLEKAGVIVTPGTAFGPSGEGYVRIALSVPIGRIDEVIDRLKKLDL
ncbi:aminotransferase class I/II-fold pyridoxal phosphate-dependent enzyme [Ornithinibacillus sp. L9]|uniref:Aminotransferase n=1 Tax=Ornithinibacillus caprae TaxID=2678566 RepID=A0A6N8FJA2_9BACI|nr:LL-diaminopimelate aminotransferase [Ornithinibacillus caprae]MUK88374.1 aminotransferase class I/II-fold pyridoxal phosphate-dependent enzyme [Ornithinibacillus caprae]